MKPQTGLDLKRSFLLFSVSLEYTRLGESGIPAQSRPKKAYKNMLQMYIPCTFLNARSRKQSADFVESRKLVHKVKYTKLTWTDHKINIDRSQYWIAEN